MNPLITAGNLLDYKRTKFGFQIFVGTPHAADVESWADKFPEGCNPDRDHREPVSMLKACADVSSAFDKISPFYTNVHFCEEKWLECSNASVSRSRDFRSLEMADQIVTSWGVLVGKHSSIPYDRLDHATLSDPGFHI